MRHIALTLALLTLPLNAAQAQTMPLPQFLAKATVLEKKGAMAIFSGDLKLLQREIAGSAGALRAERLAAVKAGGKRAYCPPAKVSIGPKEILAHFRAIPAAQRGGMRVRDGMRNFIAPKFPCPR